MNSAGPELAQVGPSRGGNACARARCANFAKRPLPVQKSEWQSLALFIRLTDICKNTLALLILLSSKSTTAKHAGPNSGELIPVGSLDDRCSTSAETKFKP